MPRSVSSHEAPLHTTLPFVGRYSPAIARRIVVLPLPEGPASAMNSPAATENLTSSGMGVACRSSTSRPRPADAASAMPATHALGQNVAEGNRKQREEKEKRSHAAGRGIVKRLDAIVDRNGDRPRLARDAAPDHQDDAELA